MRFPVLLLLVFGVSACGGSSASSGGSTASSPTPTPAKIPVANSGPIPKMTAIDRTPLPAPSPHATSAPLPTSAPSPTATPFPPSAFTVIVNGVVRDAATGAPIAGARVIVGAGLRRGTTNASGFYRVRFPAGAPVSVSVSAQGYSGGVALGTVHGRGTVRVNFKLDKRRAGKAGLPSPPQLFGQP